MRSDEKKKQFFFEKKNQKTFILRGGPRRQRPNNQKFFVSFFQKGNTSFLPYAHPLMTNTMRAVVAQAWSSPPSLCVKHLARPVVGATEMLVALDTAAVNFGDTLLAAGRYQVIPDVSRPLGTEGAGIVAEVGAEVQVFRPGDRVAICGFVGDARHDRRVSGTFAEYAVLNPANAVRIPDNVTLENAALFRSNTETASFALHKGRLAAGETLLVLGAGGGTGFAAVQLGKLAGARVIASASSEAKRTIALAAGAEHVIDSGDPAWREHVSRLTSGRGIDVVYDPVGGDATERAFRSLAWDGRLLVIGFATGRIPALPTNLPLLKGASLIGANLLEGMRMEPERCAAESIRLMARFGAGELSVPRVGGRYELEDISAAIAEVAAGQSAGRIVIKIKELESR
jgi:NADPH2:quinone reductase